MSGIWCAFTSRMSQRERESKAYSCRERERVAKSFLQLGVPPPSPKSLGGICKNRSFFLGRVCSFRVWMTHGIRFSIERRVMSRQCRASLSTFVKEVSSLPPDMTESIASLYDAEYEWMPVKFKSWLSVQEEEFLNVSV